MKALLAPVAAAISILVACGPVAAQTPSTTVAPSLSLVEQLCAAPAYSSCSSGLQPILDQMEPGQLLAVCGYGVGSGDIVLIAAEAEAESKCSSDGLVTPSRVVRIVRVP